MKLILNLTVRAAVEMYLAVYVYCTLFLHGGLSKYQVGMQADDDEDDDDSDWCSCTRALV